MSEYWTPADRRLNASRAATMRWARAKDFTAETAPARRAFEARFEKQAVQIMRHLNPDVEPDEREVAVRAARLRRAFYQELSRKGSLARRKR